jgi:hypothetical protein
MLNHHRGFMRKIGWVISACALDLVALASAVLADTYGLGIFSDSALLVLHPPDPILPVAIYQAAAGAPLNVIALDCAEEALPPEDTSLPVEYYASGLGDVDNVRWYLHITPVALTSTCVPSPTGDVSCSPAGITQTPSEITPDHCGAGDVTTLPTLGRFLTFIPPNPI